MTSRKLFIFILSLSIFGSSTFADLLGGNLYLKGEFMGSQFSSVNCVGFKHEAEKNITAGGGVGLTFPMGFRGEIVYDHVFPVTYNHSLTGKKEITANVDALMLRGLYDFVDLQLFKAFIGGGIGYAKVRHEWSVNGGIATNDGVKSDLSSKFKSNFAYNIMGGVTAEIAPSVSLDLGYLYANYGKTRAFKQLTNEGKVTLKSHNIFVGVRYEL